MWAHPGNGGNSGSPAPRRVVVITGASAGVGRAAAEMFARQGDAVALLARGRAGLEAAAKSVEAAGGQALAIPVDVSDEDAVERAAAQVEQELGPIDVWVNNAMATVFAPVEVTDSAAFRRSTEVTYLGFVWGTMSALRRMKVRDRGVIVQVGSALAYRAIPLQAAYCGAKFAIRGFTDALRSELIAEGSSIRLVMVQLPAINTPQFTWGATRMDREPRPVAPVFEPDVAARAIVAVAERPRRELWVGGRNVLAILAARVLPGALDHLLGRIGLESQLRPNPLPPDRQDNLFGPVDDESDYGAAGEFADEATARSPQLDLALRRPWPGALSKPIGKLLARMLG